MAVLEEQQVHGSSEIRVAIRVLQIAKYLVKSLNAQQGLSISSAHITQACPVAAMAQEKLPRDDVRGIQKSVDCTTLKQDWHYQKRSGKECRVTKPVQVKAHVKSRRETLKALNFEDIEWTREIDAQMCCFQQAPLTKMAADNRLFLSEQDKPDWTSLSWVEIARLLVFIYDALATLQMSANSNDRLICSGTELSHIVHADPNLLANLEHLLLRYRDSLIEVLIRKTVELVSSKRWQKLWRSLRKELWSEYPNNQRPKCTTWPWSIKPSLAVIWGVCWMFPPYESANQQFTSPCTLQAAVPVARIVRNVDELRNWPLPQTNAYARFGRQELGVPSPKSEHSEYDDCSVYNSDGGGVYGVEAGSDENWLRQRMANATSTSTWTWAGSARHPHPIGASMVRRTPHSGITPSSSYYKSRDSDCDRGRLSVASPYLPVPTAVGSQYNLTAAQRPNASQASGPSAEHQSAWRRHIINASSPQDFATDSHTSIPSNFSSQAAGNSYYTSAQPFSNLPPPAHPPLSSGSHQASPSHHLIAPSLTLSLQAPNGICAPPQIDFNGQDVVYDDASSPPEASDRTITIHNNPRDSTYYTNPFSLDMGDIVPEQYQAQQAVMTAHAPLQPSHSQQNILSPVSITMDPDQKAAQPYIESSRPASSKSPEHSGSEAADGVEYFPRRNHSYKRPEEPPRNAQGKMICKFADNSKECTNLVFDRKCEWSKHMDKHDRPYKCNARGCEKLRGFTYSGGLLRHEREVHKMHGGTKKSLYCPHPDCKRSSGSGFTRKENLAEHIRRVHRTASGGTEPGNTTNLGEESVLDNTMVHSPEPDTRWDGQNGDVMDGVDPALKAHDAEVARKRKRMSTAVTDVSEAVDAEGDDLREVIKKLKQENMEKDERLRKLEETVASLETRG